MSLENGKIYGKTKVSDWEEKKVKSWWTFLSKKYRHNFSPLAFSISVHFLQLQALQNKMHFLVFWENISLRATVSSKEIFFRLLYEIFARSNFMRYHFCWECTILPKFLPAGQFHRFIGSRRELFCCSTLQVSAWNGKFHLFWIHNKSTSFCVTASKKALSRWQAFCPGWNRINSIWLSTLDLSFYENPSLNWAENCFVSF